jgi:purine-binding chemotaxis protein CheW
MNSASPLASAPSRSAEFSAIGFRVGQEEYGLRLIGIRQILPQPPITRVPRAPAYIKGVINLQGNVVPVFDLARRFELGETQPSRTARIVVVEHNDETVGFWAESVSKVLHLKEGDLQPPPLLVAGIAAEFIEGIVRVAHRFLIFLDLARTLADTAPLETTARGDGW